MSCLEGVIMDGIIGWAVFGFIAGAIARTIKPGQRGGAWLAPILLGVLGAVVGGWIGHGIFNVGVTEFWSWSAWLSAIVGSLLVLVIWALVTRKKT